MKTTLVLTAALLASAVSASAQPSFGVKAGINISNLSTNNTDGVEPENRTGFIGGVFVTLPVSGIFAIQPEVLVGMQGAKFTEDGESAKLQLNYLQVPVLARIKAGSASPVSFLVGPS